MFFLRLCTFSGSFQNLLTDDINTGMRPRQGALSKKAVGTYRGPAKHQGICSMTRTTQGFVLPLTLWIIALAGLAVAAINSWVTMATENARALQSKVDVELTMANVKNELIYAFGTRALSFRGLEVGENEALAARQETDIMTLFGNPPESSEYLRLDGQPYVLESNPDYIIQIQDARGLVNLNSVPQPSLQRFLSLFNVSETLRNQLPDTLQDWIDEDDLTRLAGAEKTEYQRLSRHPPNNLNTVTPMETQSILGWDKVPAIWEALHCRDGPGQCGGRYSGAQKNTF
jgi:hypothetical protein